MKISEILNNFIISEASIHDQHRFKAIFMSGSPGAGKTFIAKKLFRNTGLRPINIDDLVELRIRKTGKQPDYDKEVYTELYPKLMKKMDYYISNNTGLLIDTTGKNFNSVKRKTENLKNIGYDVAMVFVDVPKDVAEKRIKKRQEEIGRSIPQDYFEESYKIIKENLPRYKQLFGKNFFYIINDEKTSNYNTESIKIYKFLNKKVEN